MKSKLLTYRDVMALTKLSRSGVINQIREGRLPQPVKIGGTPRFRRSEIEAALET